MPLAKMIRFGLAPVLVAMAWSIPLSAAPTPDAHDPAVMMARAREHAAGLEAATRVLRADGDRDLQMRRLAGEKAPDELRAVVLMCDFSDSLLLGRYGEVPGDFPPPAQSDYFYSAHDSVYFDHLLQDVAEYYRAVSGGRFTLRFTIVPEAVNLPRPMGYYGDDPVRGEQPVVLARDVVEAVDPLVDFGEFDTLILIHAGAGAETDFWGANPEQIMSTYLGPRDFAAAVADSILEDPWLAGGDFDGAGGLDRVMLLPETEYQLPFGRIGSLGVYCFEVGLRLGMLSLTDFTPAGNPDSQGIGIFGLMGYGLYSGGGLIPPEPCAFNRYLMGWLDPQEVDPLQPGPWALTPAEQPAVPTASARVDINGQEYWLLEYRLQDPNGDNDFTFDGDLNGNGIPDFWDADAPDGRPAGFFDPATDIHESLLGAEWDFAMSANPGRAPGVKAAGSGVYIWHVDEGLIREVFDAEGNLFNADPAHKAVDLEEADGIQDLDSTTPSEYAFGGDDDAFRGEGNHEFGPDTLPNTATAAGAYTGIVLRDFSNVVTDSLGAILAVDGVDTLWGIDYADTVWFTATMAGARPGGPQLAASLSLPGVDLGGCDVLAGDLDGGSSPDEIILAGHAGEVYALTGDLRSYADPGGDPTVPLVVTERDGQPVAWNLPPALGDMDGDGLPEIVLTGPRGLYAFTRQGEALVPGGEGTGLFADLPACHLPPVLVPLAGPPSDEPRPDAQVAAMVVFETAGHSFLKGLDMDQQAYYPAVDLGPGEVTAAPVLAFDRWFLVTRRDTLAGRSYLDVSSFDPYNPAAPPAVGSFELPVEPGPWPVLCGIVRPGADELRYVMIAGRDGSGVTLFFDAGMTEAGAPMVWSDRVTVASALAPGGAFVGPDLLGSVGHGGDWSDGWPRMVADVFPDAPRGGPLAVWLQGVDSPRPQWIFPLPDGRLEARGARGEVLNGWPAAGPAGGGATPALADLEGGGGLDLVAVGSFSRLTGTDGLDLDGESVSTVSVWSDVAVGRAPWPMAGGGFWRNGSYDLDPWTVLSGGVGGSGLVSGSHVCYPNPLGEGPLFVRGQARAPGRARAYVYNLEGELVTETGWRDVIGGEPFTLEVPLDGAVTGMYVCRLVVDAGGGTDASVVSFAIVR